MKLFAAMLFVALALAGCVAGAPSPGKCLACGGPHVVPFATPLQWPECDKWCVAGKATAIRSAQVRPLPPSRTLTTTAAGAIVAAPCVDQGEKK